MTSEIELENTADRGHHEEDDIRRSTAYGTVDTSVVALVVPQDLVERLGLREQGTVLVSAGDGQLEKRPIAGPLTVRIGNREAITDCVVGPPRSELTIGHTVLTMLDLIADETSGTLRPRHPDYRVFDMRRVGLIGAA